MKQDTKKLNGILIFLALMPLLAVYETKNGFDLFVRIGTISGISFAALLKAPRRHLVFICLAAILAVSMSNFALGWRAYVILGEFCLITPAILITLLKGQRASSES